MGIKVKISRALEAVLHWLLFGVSAVFSIRLFFELASTPLDKALYASLAVGFEGTKIILWEVGSKRQKLIALAMVLISLVASTGAALSVANRSSEGSLDGAKIAVYSQQLAALDQSSAQCNAGIEALTTQLAALPPTYVSAAERLQKQISLLYDRSADLQAKRISTSDALAAYRSSVSDDSATTMFRLMSRAIGIDESTFVLYFMLAIAVLLEVGALGTTERGSVENTTQSTTIVPCACGSKRTALERSADGRSWSVVCRACGQAAGMYEHGSLAIEAWSAKQSPVVKKGVFGWMRKRKT